MSPSYYQKTLQYFNQIYAGDYVPTCVNLLRFVQDITKTFRLTVLLRHCVHYYHVFNSQ